MQEINKKKNMQSEQKSLQVEEGDFPSLPDGPPLSTKTGKKKARAATAAEGTRPREPN